MTRTDVDMESNKDMEASETDSEDVIRLSVESVQPVAELVVVHDSQRAAGRCLSWKSFGSSTDDPRAPIACLKFAAFWLSTRRRFLAGCIAPRRSPVRVRLAPWLEQALSVSEAPLGSPCGEFVGELKPQWTPTRDAARRQLPDAWCESPARRGVARYPNRHAQPVLSRPHPGCVDASVVAACRLPRRDCP
jgi:hypothetical protein